MNPKTASRAATTTSQQASRPDAAAERMAVDARHDRRRAAVDRLEEGAQPARVLDALVEGDAGRRAHPLDVAAGAERRPVAGEHDRARVAASPNAAVSSAIVAGSSALCRSGRASVTRARPPSRSIRTAPTAREPTCRPARYRRSVRFPSRRLGTVLPAAVVGVATVVALASAWHSGGHVWRRLDSGYRTYSAYTPAQRRHAPIDAIPLRATSSTSTPITSSRGDRVYFLVLRSGFGQFFTLPADRRRDRPLLPPPGGAGEEPPRRHGRRHVRPRPVDPAGPVHHRGAGRPAADLRREDPAAVTARVLALVAANLLMLVLGAGLLPRPAARLDAAGGAREAAARVRGRPRRDGRPRRRARAAARAGRVDRPRGCSPPSRSRSAPAVSAARSDGRATGPRSARGSRRSPCSRSRSRSSSRRRGSSRSSRSSRPTAG